MDQSLLTIAAGMQARMETLQVLGNNIANAPTSGYKADREFYRLFRTAQAQPSPQGNAPWMPFIQGSQIDFSQGPLIRTEAPLDLALSGSGFLVARSPSGTLYTRSGSLVRSPGGVLETAEGYPVLSANGAEITIPAVGEVEILSDGLILVDGLAAGQLSIVEFPAASRALSKVGHSYFGAPDGIDPQAATATDVLQGRLEGSNVNAPQEAVQLILANRHFGMMRRVATLIGDEMNGRAVSELGRSS